MPAPYFEQAFWQLTSAELIALGVEHNGLDPDPDLPAQTQLSAFGVVAWWERAGVIASAYDFIEVHYNLWVADAEAWLLDSGMETGRAAMLAAGGILVDERNGARNADGLVRTWLNPLGSHAGFTADPFLWWSGAGNPQTATQRMRLPNGTDVTGPAAAAAWMIANRPVGNRGLRLGSNYPFGYKTQRPDGAWVLGNWDNDLFSKWPQLWLTGDWQEQVATQWRTWLTAYAAAGGTLDYITTDNEWDRTIPKLADVAHEVRCTPGGVAAGRTFTMTIGSGSAQHTATDTNAATVVNALAVAWNASVDANLTPYTAVGVTSGTPYVRITPDNVLTGVSVPTTLTLTATSPGTFSKSTVNGDHRPASTQGTTWYADLKAEADAETVMLTPATVEVGDQFKATRGATTISFTCTAGATEAARVSNVVAGFVAAWNASASADITPIKAHAGANYSTLNSSGVVLLQYTSPAVAFASSISTSTTNGGAANTQTFTKSTVTRDFENDYFVDLTDIETHVSFYDPTAWEFAEAQHEVQREALIYAIEEPVSAVLGDELDLMDYDSTLKANGWYSSGTPAKRFSSPFGCGRMYGTHQSRAMYHASVASGNTVEAYFPNGVGNIRVPRTAWAHALADVFFLHSMIAASQRPLALWVCSYTFTNYLTAEQDFVFDMLACMCSEWVFYWNASNNETVAAEDVIEDAAQQAYANMEGSLGVPLPMPPRGRWDVAENLNADIVQDFLLNGRILTITIHNDFTWELSERDNVTNVAPVLASISNQTAAVGTPFSGVSASATDKNTGDDITYSITSGPGWLSIHATTGALSGTPDTDGVNSVTVRATDNGTPAMYDETTFLMTVSGAVANTAPVIDAISAQQVAEGSLLSFTVTAEDAEDDAITFTLINSPPSGAAITTGGAFTWTPSEAQGPGFYTITVQATDDGTPNLSSTKSFSVTVTEVNTAPVLSAISNQTVNEHELLTVQCSATDADLPAQALTYSLPTAPTGMLIGATTGTLTWTPDETQGSVTPYNVTVRVTDSGGLYHERSFTVTVTETNTAPVLASIGEKFGAETVLLTFTATATDADVPAQTLTFSLTGSPPSGAAIGSSSGVFTWTPNSSQAGEYDITIRVTDNGSGNLYDEETVHFTILDTNLPPVLAAIGDQSATEDIELTFTASATDADVGQTITYSLADAPEGATIDGDTGEFSWTPEPGQGGQEYELTVLATDNGSPPASDSETITITVTAVNHAPILATIGNKTTPRDTFLSFTLMATDPDGVAVPLAYSADTLPPGSQLDSLTGEFAWAPTSSHIGEHSVTFSVTDGELTDSETITITVTDVQATERPRRVNKAAAAPASGAWWKFKGTGALRNE